MSGVRDLYDGFCTFAATADVSYAWNPNGRYSSGVVGFFTAFMPATPDRAFALFATPMGDSVTQPIGQVRFQLQARGERNNPLDPEDLLDPVFKVLQGATAIPSGDYRITQVYRTNRVELGTDDNVRRTVADVYYADVDYPPTVLRPEFGSW